MPTYSVDYAFGDSDVQRLPDKHDCRAGQWPAMGTYNSVTASVFSSRPVWTEPRLMQLACSPDQDRY